MSEQRDLFAPGPTLAAARRELMETGRWTGVSCPCCDQLAKVYRYKLGSSQAQALLRLFRHQRRTGEEWSHVHNLLVAGGSKITSYSKLKHWGFIETRAGRSEDGNHSGYYRVTEAGKDFALGRSSVPRYAVVYADELLRLEGAPVAVQEALGDAFSYAELMSPVDASP